MSVWFSTHTTRSKHRKMCFVSELYRTGTAKYVDSFFSSFQNTGPVPYSMLPWGPGTWYSFVYHILLYFTLSFLISSVRQAFVENDRLKIIVSEVGGIELSSKEWEGKNQDPAIMSLKSDQPWRSSCNGGEGVHASPGVAHGPPVWISPRLLKNFYFIVVRTLNMRCTFFF